MIEVALAAALISAAPFQSGDWRFGGGSPDFVLGYDHSSIRVTGSTRTLSTMSVAGRTETIADKTYDYAVYETTVSCHARSVEYHQTDMYLFSWDLVPNVSFMGRQGARTPDPGSASARLIEAVCGDRLQPSMPGGRGRSVRSFALWFRVSLEAGNIR